MDTTVPDIVFDDQGVCNLCKAAAAKMDKEVLPEGQRRAVLDKVLKDIKRRGKGRPYDCLVGVSGGVDSTTLALYAHDWGLRVLAVHVDNGWNSELAVKNIQSTLDQLGFDLTTVVLNWEEFRDLQLAFFRAGVANMEIPTDHAINSCLFRTASRSGIRTILSGGNVASEAIMPSSWMYNPLDGCHIKAIQCRFGTRPLRTFPLNGLVRWAYYVFAKRLLYVPILNLIGYNKDEAKARIMRELGWRDYGAKHFESIYTRFFQGYILPRKFNIDKRKAHFSSLIVAGHMTRDNALRELQRPPYDPVVAERDREYFIKKMEMTENEFEAVMGAPPVPHERYPNRALVFKSASLLRMVRKVATAGLGKS
jgi:N-acetyl sugar amidotransferase